MIRSFASKDTERLFHGLPVPRFRSFERAARKKLQLVHAARHVNDLLIFPIMNSYLSEIHPGEILRDELIAPMGLSESSFTEALDAPREEILALIAETGPVTVALAHALANYFKTSVEFWLNLQAEYDARTKNGGRQ